MGFSETLLDVLSTPTDPFWAEHPEAAAVFDAYLDVETLIWTDTWLKRSGRWQIIAAEDLIPAQ
ncbi:MAG TPA: hypothetical protein VMT11_16770 [Myxococcaceae bacterium]|nr:hypothetical protein [Myxococcaceae bacterium]